MREGSYRDFVLKATVAGFENTDINEHIDSEEIKKLSNPESMAIQTFETQTDEERIRLAPMIEKLRVHEISESDMTTFKNWLSSSKLNRPQNLIASVALANFGDKDDREHWIDFLPNSAESSVEFRFRAFTLGHTFSIEDRMSYASYPEVSDSQERAFSIAYFMIENEIPAEGDESDLYVSLFIRQILGAYRKASFPKTGAPFDFVNSSIETSKLYDLMFEMEPSTMDYVVRKTLRHIPASANVKGKNIGFVFSTYRVTMPKDKSIDESITQLDHLISKVVEYNTQNGSVYQFMEELAEVLEIAKHAKIEAFDKYKKLKNSDPAEYYGSNWREQSIAHTYDSATDPFGYRKVAAFSAMFLHQYVELIERRLHDLNEMSSSYLTPSPSNPVSGD